MQPQDSTLDILKQALLLEHRGRAFYQEIADRTPNPTLKQFFSTMAQEETGHIEMLTHQFKAYRENGLFDSDFSTPPAEGTTAASVLNADLKTEIAAAGYEAAAIAAAISMEDRAVRLYSERAAGSNDPAEKALYGWLAQWERGHLEALTTLDRELVESIWHDNQFWALLSSRA